MKMNAITFIGSRFTSSELYNTTWHLRPDYKSQRNNPK